MTIIKAPHNGLRSSRKSLQVHGYKWPKHGNTIDRSFLQLPALRQIRVLGIIDFRMRVAINKHLMAHAAEEKRKKSATYVIFGNLVQKSNLKNVKGSVWRRDTIRLP